MLRLPAGSTMTVHVSHGQPGLTACSCAAGSNNGALLHQGCDKVLIEDTTFVSNTGARTALCM